MGSDGSQESIGNIVLVSRDDIATIHEKLAIGEVVRRPV